MTSRLTWSLWGLATFLSVGVAIFSYRFLPGIGPRSPDILANLFARPWLAVHAGAAGTALLIGPIQFLPAWRRVKGAHKWLGRVYAVSCIIGGLAGLRLAFGTTAGTFAGIGFGQRDLTRSRTIRRRGHLCERRSRHDADGEDDRGSTGLQCSARKRCGFIDQVPDPSIIVVRDCIPSSHPANHESRRTCCPVSPSRLTLRRCKTPATNGLKARFTKSGPPCKALWCGAARGFWCV